MVICTSSYSYNWWSQEHTWQNVLLKKPLTCGLEIFSEHMSFGALTAYYHRNAYINWLCDSALILFGRFCEDNRTCPQCDHTITMVTWHIYDFMSGWCHIGSSCTCNFFDVISTACLTFHLSNLCNFMDFQFGYVNAVDLNQIYSHLLLHMWERKMKKNPGASRSWIHCLAGQVDSSACKALDHTSNYRAQFPLHPCMFSFFSLTFAEVPSVIWFCLMFGPRMREISSTFLVCEWIFGNGLAKEC